MNAHLVYDSWREYREQVTEYILNSCAAGSSMAVFGAGRCADIDIGRLSKHYSRIYLVDRDTEAMRQGVRYYFGNDGLSVDENGLNFKNSDLNAGADGLNFKSGACVISLVEKDFVGLNSDDFAVTSKYCGENLAPAIKQGKLDLFAKGLYGIIERIYQKNKSFTLDFSDIKTDYAVALGTHSQLNNNFSAQWMVYRLMLQRALKLPESNSMDCNNIDMECSPSEIRLIKSLDNISKGVEELQRRNTDFIVERFNGAIQIAAGRGIIFGLETGNTGISHSEIDGAHNALMYLERKVCEGVFKETQIKSYVWPFDTERNIYYDVRLGLYSR